MTTNETNDNRPTLRLEDRTAVLDAMAPPLLLSVHSLLTDLLGDLSARHTTQQGGGWTGGLRCGLSLIDNDLRGLRPGSVTILNAEPNIGKSTLCNQIAYQVAAYPGQKAAALYVSFENDPLDLLLKHVSRLSGWSINDLLDGKVSPNDSRLRQAIGQLSGVPLFYLRGNAAASPELIEQRCHEVKALLGGDVSLLLVIDYLQYFARFSGAPKQIEQIGIALSRLDALAQDTQAALLVIGSQNRDTNRSGSASLYGGRGSGEIEYDADTLLSLTQEQRQAPGGAKALRLLAVKTRFGGAGASLDLDFHTERALLTPAQDQEAGAGRVPPGW